ncbi:hypothetical protein D3C84_698360 [compost metagenome]
MTHGRQLLGEVAKATPRIQDPQRPVAESGQAGFDVAPHHSGADAPLGGVVNVAGELVGASVKTLILLQGRLIFGHTCPSAHGMGAQRVGPQEKRGVFCHIPDLLKTQGRHHSV